VKVQWSTKAGRESEEVTPQQKERGGGNSLVQKEVLGERSFSEVERRRKV
jgi:hypothetical protein